MSMHIYDPGAPPVPACRRFRIRRVDSWRALYRSTANDPHTHKVLRKLTRSGFNAAVYALGERRVLTFEGSNAPLSRKGFGDWKTNFLNALGIRTAQYEFARTLAALAKRKYPNLTLAGHSLGGGLAMYAATGNRLTAFIFNPAYPRGARARGWARRHVHATVMQGEAVDFMQRRKRPATTTVYPNHCGHAVSKHGIACVVRTLAAACR